VQFMWQELNFICTTGWKGQVDFEPSINRKREGKDLWFVSL